MGKTAERCGNRDLSRLFGLQPRILVRYVTPSVGLGSQSPQRGQAIWQRLGHRRPPPPADKNAYANTKSRKIAHNYGDEGEDCGRKSSRAKGTGRCVLSCFAHRTDGMDPWYDGLTAEDKILEYLKRVNSPFFLLLGHSCAHT